MNPTVYILRGVLAFILGLILVIWPGATLKVILILFPIFAIIDGTAAILIGERTYKQGKWLYFIPMGIFEILIGILLFVFPNMIFDAFLLLMAIWAFLLGLGELFVAFSADDFEPELKWCHIIGGILTIVLGICVLIYPIITSIIFLWLFGIFFVIYGILVFIVGISFLSRFASKSKK
jgi:uncharacterized membrane protein HdeD (DUF308 family)